MYYLPIQQARSSKSRCGQGHALDEGVGAGVPFLSPSYSSLEVFLGL